MSLSELCRLPVSNLRLSAHISAPWTEKKKNLSVKRATKARQKASMWTDRFVPTPAPPAQTEQAAGQEETRTVVCVAAAQASAKSARLALTLTSAFCL